MNNNNHKIASYKCLSKYFLKKRLPYFILLELTNYCNGSCPQCGMNKENNINRYMLNRDRLYKIIDNLAKQNVYSISITGGEPFINYNTIIDLLIYASKKGIPMIHTGTNGFMFRDYYKSNFKKRISNLASDLKKSNIHTFWISIDSADIFLHEKMRGLPGVIEGIKKAIPIFHEKGIYPSASICINRNIGGQTIDLYNIKNISPKEYFLLFKEAFHKVFQFVIDIGFTIISTGYPIGNNNQKIHKKNYIYNLSSSDKTVNFTYQEKILLYRALYEIIPEYRDKVRLFTPRSTLLNLINYYTGNKKAGNPCRCGLDFFYIDCQYGYIYPCGNKGEQCLGLAENFNFDKNINSNPCRECDMQEFRDTSDLLTPFTYITDNIFRFIKKYISNDIIDKNWRKDLSYMNSCDFYNHQIKPDIKKLKKFKMKKKQNSLPEYINIDLFMKKWYRDENLKN